MSQWPSLLEGQKGLSARDRGYLATSYRTTVRAAFKTSTRKTGGGLRERVEGLREEWR